MTKKKDAREILLYSLESEAAFGVDRLPLTQRDRFASPLSPFDALAGEVQTCTACPLHETRTNTVFGEGSSKADIVFVGEGPGRDEDLSGRPFVGRAGRLLTKMIGAMGYKREDVFIANVVKCRPPGNRTPMINEIASCLRFLRKQIELISPKIIVALGAPATRTLLDTRSGIKALRGKIFDYPLNEEILVVPTFHPSYLLRDPSEKPKAWEDLRLVLKTLARNPPDRKPSDHES